MKMMMPRLVKLNGYIVTAIDGSDIVMPSTAENAEKYGRHNPKAHASPVIAKLSLVYDCINKLVIDTCVGVYKHSERAYAALTAPQLIERDAQTANNHYIRPRGISPCGWWIR